MAKVHIESGQGAVGTGDLQLENGAAMDATLRPVTDAANTASPLELSTGLVAVTSTLQIATTDTEYIDAEDGSGNNRFTVSRQAGSQVVDVDFASNPTSATDQVGAIRTYQDGVSLSDTMAFLRNGNVGVGTSTPSAKLDVNGISQITGDSAGTGQDPLLNFNNTDTSLGTNQILGTIDFSQSDPSGGGVGVVNRIRSLNESSFQGEAALTFWTGTAASLAEHMRITSTGNVTIKAPLSSNGGVLNLENTSTAVNGQDWGSVNFISNDSSTSASGIRASIVGASTSFNGDGNLVFSTAPSNGVNTERMRTTFDGYLRMASGSGGIQFNGDTAAANALDDYEEGTFTPNPVGATFSTALSGHYTKIGNRVFFTIATLSNTITGASGPASLTGLPFTASNTALNYGVVTLSYTNAFTSSVTSGYVEKNSTTIYFTQDTGTTDAVFSNGTANRNIMISGFYNV
jgi:hypothetical protein